MLRQILNDMYVDPIILSGLDEYQKQTLFCKMREEQIRRWRVREQENETQTATPKKSTPNKKNNNVSFREDNEGEPWVVIIEPVEFQDSDSDDSDLSMKKPGHEEEKQKARELAEIETIEIRRQYKEIITASDNNKNNKLNSKKDEVDDGTPIIDDMQIYCSVEELRERMSQTKLLTAPTVNGIITSSNKLKNGTLDNNVQSNNIINFSFADKPKNTVILKEISKTKPSQKVSQKIALWEQRVIGEKTTEIYQRLRKKQKEEAEQEAKRQEEAWKEQERKAKEADIQYRELARRAREEYRKSLTNETSPTTNGTDAVHSNGTTAKPMQNGTHLAHNESKGLTNGHNAPVNGIKPMTNGVKPMTNGTRNGIHSPYIVGASTKGPAPKPPIALNKPIASHQMHSTPQKHQQQQLIVGNGNGNANGNGNVGGGGSPPSSLETLIPRPSSHDAMIQWYHKIEIGKGSGLESIISRLPCKWFYGLMSRTEAERILETEPLGTFLVRLSEKIWGYAISYKDSERCKHYLINASTGQYKFLGANQMNHDTLSKRFFSIFVPFWFSMKYIFTDNISLLLFLSHR